MAHEAAYRYLQCDQASHILTITMDREEKLNAMNRQMMQEITACFARVAEDQEVRCVILTGKGKAFMAGADIGEYQDAPVGEFMAFQEKGREMYRMIEECPKPVLAAVNGYALGGGFELALSCDCILSTQQAIFGLPEVKLGLVPGGGGIQKILRTTNPFQARDILLSGRNIGAAEGQELGFVQRLAEDQATLMKEARQLAVEWAGNAPLAVQMLKKLVRQGGDASLETAQGYDRAALTCLFYSQDAQEGIAAFMEKRQPQFKGE